MLPLVPFYCCLNSRERSVMQQMGTWFGATGGTRVPISNWRAFWGITGSAFAAYSSLFAANYRLNVVPTGSGAGVYFLDPIMWGQVAVFVLTPAAACVGGCVVWYPS